jgi:putative ABC transport system permease protein
VWRTTFKNLLGRKRRLVTTGIAVLLGVAFMSGTFVLTDTLNRTFQDLFSDVYENVDAHVRAEAAFESEFGGAQRPNIDAELVEVVQGVEGVDRAVGSLQGYTQIVGPDGEPVGNPAGGAPTFGGNWIEDRELDPFVLDEGRAPEAEGEVVIDRASAEATGYGPGDEARLLTSQGTIEVTVVGVVRFGEVDSPAGASYVLFTDEQSQEVLAEPGQWASVEVAGAEGVGQEELADRIAAAVPEGIEVLTGEEISEEASSEFEEALGFFNTMLLVFAGVALFVGAFIIYNTFSILVAQRTRELALLRAIGASRGQVLGSVVVEAAVVGLVAAVLGLGVGLALAIGLREALAALGIDLPATGIVVLPRTIVVGMVVGLVVTVLAALLPARRAARVAPVAAMREVSVDRSSRSLLRLVAGVVVTGIGAALAITGLVVETDAAASLVGAGVVLTFVGVTVLGPIIARPVAALLGAPLPRLRGMSGTLARQNAMRNPKRTATTAAALMIGVTLVGFITIVAASTRASITAFIDDVVTGDFIISSGGFAGSGGLDPSLTEQIAGLPEVASAAGLRFGPAEIAGQGGFVIGTDIDALAAIVDLGVVGGGTGALDADGIAVGEQTADANGWAVGDTIEATFARSGTQELTIEAVYEAEDVVGRYLLGLSAYEANLGRGLDSQVFVELVDGADAAAAREAIDGVAEAFPNATVQDLTEYADAQAAQVDQLLNLVYVLLALAVVIALIGIANTLALSIHERTHELGLLRAVGMTRRQLRSSVRWESVIIALLGTALGLVLAVAFGVAIFATFQDQGLTELSLAPGQLAVIAVLAALAGVVAAIGPARKAAKLDILGAIATE